MPDPQSGLFFRCHLQDLFDSVDVIGIIVRQEDRFDPADPPALQVRQDSVLSNLADIGTPAVRQKDVLPGLQDQAVALSDIQHRQRKSRIPAPHQAQDGQTSGQGTPQPLSSTHPAI